MIHLTLAIGWLVFGAGLLAWQWVDPEVPAMHIWGTHISIGWFAVAMGVYNLVRWGMSYSVRRHARRAREASHSQRGSAALDRSQAAPDPNFDFTREPPTTPKS